MATNLFKIYEIETDGVTDLTSEINAATAAADAAGGGIVRLAAGTFVHSAPIDLYPNVILEGAGMAATTLFLAASSNCASVIVIDPDGSTVIANAANITALFGTDDANTPGHFGLRHLTIDGNRANQSASASPQYQSGLLCYAHSYLLEHVRFQNIYGRAIMSEWASSGEVQPSMGSKWHNVVIDGCNRDGIYYNGPHDCDWRDVIVVDAGTGTDDTYDALYIGSKGNGRRFNFHCWARSTTTNFCRYGINAEGSSNEFVVPHVEGVNRPVRINGDANRLVEGHYYSARAVDADTNPYFLTIAGDNNRATGQINNTSNNDDAMGIHLGADHGLGGGKNYARGNYINLGIKNLTDQPVVVSTDSGNNHIELRGASATGTWTEADIDGESWDATTDVIVQHEATPTVDYNRRFRRDTFTPTVDFATTGDFSPTYDSQFGWYAKNGNMVTFIIKMQFDTNAYTTASGAIKIGGLPFTPALTGAIGQVRSVNGTVPADGTNVALATNGVDTLGIQTANSSGNTAWTTSFAPASTNDILIEIQGSYVTND